MGGNGDDRVVSTSHGRGPREGGLAVCVNRVWEGPVRNDGGGTIDGESVRWGEGRS